MPLSKSLIWRDIRAYYEAKGVSAWQPNAVPNYITTNPFIAQAYARVINSFFEIHSPKRRGNKNDDTCYILELGAGSGRFAYHFLKNYFSEMEASAHKKRKTVYVMTDISTSTIDFWQNQPQLAPFVADGRLDFAKYDILNEGRIDLIVAGKTLDASTIDSSMAVVANYVIDSLPHDFFAIEDGRLYERLIRYNKAASNHENAIPKSTFEVDYRNQPCPSAYYKKSLWDGVLAQYVDSFNDLNFALPVGGFKMLETLSKISRKPLFVLSSDFGVLHDLDLRQLGPRRIAVNGAFSIHVNFNALKRYAELKGMPVLFCETAKLSLETMGIIVHPGRGNLAPLYREFSRQFQAQGPDEFFMMKKIAEKAGNDLSLQNIVGLLRFSNYDSRIFDLCCRTLKTHLKDSDISLKIAIRDALLRVEEMHYRFEEKRDPTLKILQMLLQIGEYEPAREIAIRNSSLLEKVEVGQQIWAELFERKSSEK